MRPLTSSFVENGFWLMGVGVAAMVVILQLIAWRRRAGASTPITRTATAGAVVAAAWLSGSQPAGWRYAIDESNRDVRLAVLHEPRNEEHPWAA